MYCTRKVIKAEKIKKHALDQLYKGVLGLKWVNICKDSVYVSVNTCKDSNIRLRQCKN